MRPAVGSGMPSFLRYLANLPKSAGVLAAMVHGPLGPFGATAGSLMQPEGDSLVLLDGIGYREDELDRYAVIPLSVDMPFTRAVLQGTTSVLPAADLLPGFPHLDVDEALWSSIFRRTDARFIVTAPMTSDDLPVGAYGFLSRDEPDPGLLEALSAALGLWLTNPKTPKAPPRGRTDHPLLLTTRHREILKLAETGATTAEIAATLGYSESTVKQDIQRVMRSLRVHDRHAAVARARELGLL